MTIRSDALGAVLMVLTCILLVACSRRESSPSQDAANELTAFASAFTEVGAVELEQPDSAVIGMLVGLAIDTNGNFVVGDASERDIKVYSGGGKFLVRIARRGEGPGEVSTAAVPSLAQNGEILAALFARNRVLVFTKDYAYSRSITLDSTNAIGSTVMTAAGTYLSVGFNTGGKAVLESDATGKFVAWHVVSDSIPVRDSPEHPVWGALSAYGAVQVGDSIFVTNSLSDSLWRIVREPRHSIRALSVAFPGFREARLPDPASMTAPGGPFAAMDVVHPPRRLGQAVIVPIGRGRYLDSDSNLVVVVQGSTVQAYSDAPPILATHDDEVIGLDPLEFAAGRVILRRYRRGSAELAAGVEATHAAGLRCRLWTHPAVSLPTQ